MKISNKGLLDIRAVMYFSPIKTRVTRSDKEKYHLLSSKGIKPKRVTKGYERLLNGKMWRDYQISAWMEDIRQGYFTKHEIISSVPIWLQPSIQQKLANVPYDINYRTSNILIKMAQKGGYK